jgi:hypothetical protein
MPTKLDYIILCDIADTEPAGFIQEWLDGFLKRAELRPFDASEHLQFGVQVTQAAKKADAVILCLTDNFTPIQFSQPEFQSAIAHDPDCTKGLVVAVAVTPLRPTEIQPVISIIDAWSGDEKERRRRFLERIAATPKPSKKRATKKAPSSAGTSITQNVGKARNVIAANGPVNFATKHVTRTEFTPDERHITPEQASRIKRLVDDLVEMDDAAGKAIGRSYQQWWKMLNNTFEVTTYKEIPRERFEEALSFLQQAKARNLPKIRRKDNELWRKKHYQVIFGIGKRELGWSDDEIHSFATLKLGKPVASLSDIGERDLAKLARQIRAEARKR